MSAGRKINTLSTSWGTPIKYVKLIKEFFNGNIDFDPCSNEFSIVDAKVEICLPEDGLKCDWNYKTIFVNPPYGKDKERKTSIKDWLYKCVEANEKHNSEVLVLIPVATNTSHWKKYVFPKATLICFLNDTRLRFLENGQDVGKGAPMACCIVYYGKYKNKFIEMFSNYGSIVETKNK